VVVFRWFFSQQNSLLLFWGGGLCAFVSEPWAIGIDCSITWACLYHVYVRRRWWRRSGRVIVTATTTRQPQRRLNNNNNNNNNRRRLPVISLRPPPESLCLTETNSTCRCRLDLLSAVFFTASHVFFALKIPNGL